jgi:NDP-sugar pyrophosphorylase family protein
LTYLLEQLRVVGFREVVLLTGYKAEQVFEAVGEDYENMHLIHSPETTPLGTGGALRNALSRLDAAHVLLLNGDSWCEVDLIDFRKFHHLNNADLSMVVTEAADPSRFGVVQIAPDGRVERFEEKTVARSGWINAGIYLVARGLIEEIPAGEPVSLERVLIPRWIRDGRQVFGYRHTGRFLDIGTPESYAAAARFIPKPKPAACGFALTRARRGRHRAKTEEGGDRHIT